LYAFPSEVNSASEPLIRDNLKTEKQKNRKTEKQKNRKNSRSCQNNALNERTNFDADYDG